MCMVGPEATASKATPPSGAALRRRARRRAWLGWLTVLALVVAAGGALAWRFLLRPPEVEVAQARVGEAVEAVYASGVVEYVRQADVASIVTAPIREVLVAEGQTVRRGQVMAQLEDGPQQGSTLQLEAQAALARAGRDRAKRLLDAGFGARAAYEDAAKTAAAATAAADGARAHLRDFQIRAPFDGRILRREAEPGDLAATGKMQFVVADPTTLRVTADIDERDVGKLAVGQAAIVRADAFPDRTFDASIAEITPAGDSTARVFRARLLLSPDTPLRPGMTVEANLVVERRTAAVLAPSKAVRDGAVYVLDGEQARLRKVIVGVQGPEQTEIRSGVAAGATVILSPPDKLKDGDKVRVRRP